MAIQISVIIPCYNGGKLIEAAIKSVIENDKKGRVELFVINDGSTDDTEQRIMPYAGENVRCISLEKNSGCGYARNLAFESVRGRWCMYLDADDLYLTDCFNDRFFEKLEEYEKRGVEVICTPRLKTDVALENEPDELLPQPFDEVTHHIPNLEFWCNIYSTKFLKENDIKFFTYREVEVETAFKYMVFSLAKNPVIDNSLHFVLQRDNPKSVTHTWNLYRLYEIKAMVYSELCERAQTLDEDKGFLLGTSAESLYKYYGLCKTKGVNSKEAFKNMREVLKKVKAQSGTITLDPIGAQNLKDALICDKKRLFFKKAQIPPKPPKKDEPEQDLEGLLKRLAEISRNYGNK